MTVPFSQSERVRRILSEDIVNAIRGLDPGPLPYADRDLYNKFLVYWVEHFKCSPPLPYPDTSVVEMTSSPVCRLDSIKQLVDGDKNDV